VWPTSFHQEQRLIVEELRDLAGVGRAAFAVPVALELPNELDTEAFRLAVDTLVHRHSAFRCEIFPSPGVDQTQRRARLMVFQNIGLFYPGLFMQRVHEQVSVPFAVHRLASLPQTERTTTMRIILNREASTPFDYRMPPLLRVRVFEVEPRKWLVVLVISHLIMDRWSVGLVQKELVGFYNQIVSGRNQLAVPEVPGFPEFCAWQHAAIPSSSCNASVEYWKTQWQTFGCFQARYSELPPYAPTTTAGVVSMGIRKLTLTVDQSQHVLSFAQENRLTVFMLFTGAILDCIQQLTASPAVALLGNFGNRVRPGARNMVGWFNNGHLIGVTRAQLSGTSLLHDVRGTILRGLQHQHIPSSYYRRYLSPVGQDYAFCPIQADSGLSLPAAESSEHIQFRCVQLSGEMFPIGGPLGLLFTIEATDEHCFELSVRYRPNLFREESVADFLTQVRESLFRLIGAL
jgi:hypothetical protein